MLIDNKIKMPKKVDNIIGDSVVSKTKKEKPSEIISKEEELPVPTPTPIDTTTNFSKKEKELAMRKNILDEFENIINMLNLEIQNCRESSSKTTNVKFLRLLNKNIKSLQTQCVRVMKQKNITVRQNNNSGFQKPVKLSSELAKFTGWSENELKSRVDVTKYICDYIATNKLQNPQDKRQILPDSKLQKLLGINPEKSDKPLYYYGIQTYLKNQNHFPKD
jgi:chromatin remodeling complex protein RSC6